MNFLLKTFILLALLAGMILPIFGSTETISSQHSQIEERPIVVMGGGIGGLTSALYLARSGLSPLVIEGISPGGLLKQSHSVQNWPGELEIEGAALVEKIRHQVQESGAQFLSEEVIGVDFSKRPFVILTRTAEEGKTREIRAAACIIAMGTEPNFLNIPGESGTSGYWGRGVTNCAICDGPFYRDQRVGVVGGGDAAVLEALYLSDLAKEVNVFVRKGSFKAVEKKRLETLLARPNVKIFYNTEVASIQGDGEKVTGVLLKSKKGIALDGLFLAIGSKPNSALFKNALKLDPSGYIVLNKDQQTSIEGVYAIGDIVDPVYKQAISAAGDGAKAALQAQQFLGDHGLSSKSTSSFAKDLKIEAPPIEIESAAQFEEELSQNDKLLVIDFYAPWCGPCKHIAPLLDRAAKKFPSKIKILKINVEKFPDLAKEHKVQSIPTLVILDSSGKLADRKAGTGEITSFLQNLE